MREETRRCFTHSRSRIGVTMGRDVGLILEKTAQPGRLLWSGPKDGCDASVKA